jgi:hypothetical protein
MDSEDSVHGCLAPELGQNTVAAVMCGEGASHLTVERKQRNRRGLGTWSLQTPVTSPTRLYFPTYL